jgi:hypothetical protein
VDCFLACHVTKFEPKYTANPPVDFLSSIMPAQSASAKVLTRVDFLMYVNAQVNILFHIP